MRKQPQQPQHYNNIHSDLLGETAILFVICDPLLKGERQAVGMPRAQNVSGDFS
jgi:hypothetical protein